MKKQLKAYFKAIKKNLPCVNSTMKTMLGDLKTAVDTYINDNNVTDFEKIVEHFGTAEDIAKEFAVGLDNAYVKSYKFKKRVIAIVVSLLAVIMVAVSALVIYLIAMVEDNKPVSEGTTIVYENGDD